MKVDDYFDKGYKFLSVDGLKKTKIDGKYRGEWLCRCVWKSLESNEQEKSYVPISTVKKH